MKTFRVSQQEFNLLASCIGEIQRNLREAEMAQQRANREVAILQGLWDGIYRKLTLDPQASFSIVNDGKLTIQLLQDNMIGLLEGGDLDVSEKEAGQDS